MIEAYPLTWPMGWPRSKYQDYSRLARYPLGKALQELNLELGRLGATNIVISTNLQTRLDGLPRSGQRQPEDSGVAVYFKLDSNDQCIPCDKWTTVEQNLRAITKTIEALRGIERWGAKEMVNAAFRGFKALPASGEATLSSQRLWHEVLEVSPTASWDVIEVAYRRLLHKVHPDKGGTVEAFTEVQNAFKQAKGNR